MPSAVVLVRFDATPKLKNINGLGAILFWFKCMFCSWYRQQNRMLIKRQLLDQNPSPNHLKTVSPQPRVLSDFIFSRHSFGNIFLRHAARESILHGFDLFSFWQRNMLPSIHTTLPRTCGPGSGVDLALGVKSRNGHIWRVDWGLEVFTGSYCLVNDVRKSSSHMHRTVAKIDKSVDNQDGAPNWFNVCKHWTKWTCCVVDVVPWLAYLLSFHAVAKWKNNGMICRLQFKSWRRLVVKKKCRSKLVLCQCSWCALVRIISRYFWHVCFMPKWFRILRFGACVSFHCILIVFWWNFSYSIFVVGFALAGRHQAPNSAGGWVVCKTVPSRIAATFCFMWRAIFSDLDVEICWPKDGGLKNLIAFAKFILFDLHGVGVLVSVDEFLKCIVCWYFLENARLYVPLAVAGHCTCNLKPNNPEIDFITIPLLGVEFIRV